MLKIERDVVQPLGAHNPAYPCVRTSCVKDLVEYSFTHFNPPQSEFCEILNDDCNIGVFWPTAAGKTVAMELANAKALSEGKACLNLFPLKALTEEKLMDWTDPSHTFSSNKIVPITGDYILTEKKKRELSEADIIVATSEMLDSKTRNYSSNPWLKRIGLLVVDEAHLIGSEARGPRLESAILRFCEKNPRARIVLMSATVPNCLELCEWIENLTGKTTKMMESNYRPCLLHKQYNWFDDNGKSKIQHYDQVERLRMVASLNLINENPEDQHLVFCGPKSWGYQFKDFLLKHGINSEFHNADLPKEKRREIENKFRNKEIHILVSTSTLSWGCNLPARRVILAHTNYGVTPMEVCDIEQAWGRSGRPKYDNEGNAYTLIPKSIFQKEKERIENGFQVTSHIYEIPNLAFQTVSEVANGNIRTVDDFREWYRKTLSHLQGHRLSDEDCQNVFDLLENKKMIREQDDLKGVYDPTHLGKISSSMYMNPLDVYDWFVNFSTVEEINLYEKVPTLYNRRVDKQVSMALAGCYEFRKNRQYCSRSEKNTKNVKLMEELTGKKADGVLKAAACYYAMANGHKIDPPLEGLAYGLKVDLKRILATMKMVHGRVGKHMDMFTGYKFDEKEWDVLYLRIIYGISVDLINLVTIPGIGREFARKLYDKSIKNVSDFVSKKETAITVLGEKRYNTILENIKT